jgi:hypothetical protein
MTCALVTALLLVAPARADEPRSRVTSTVEEMNRPGFAEFAAIKADVKDPMVSPLLMWYVHRFLALKSHDEQARALVGQLRRSGVAIDATMQAVRGRSAYTDTVASYESEDLAAKTVWYEPKVDYEAWELKVEIHIHDTLGDYFDTDPDTSRVRAPFYARDGIRAVRLDIAHGSRMLFLFWATPSVLTDLRARMSPSLWKSMSSGFTESEIMIANFGLRGWSDVPVPISAEDGFGVVREPQRYAAADAWTRMSVSRSEATAHLTSTVKGFPTVFPPGYPYRPGAAVDSIHYCCFIPEDHRLAANEPVPLIYVVQDTQTGAILLMGQNG